MISITWVRGSAGVQLLLRAANAKHSARLAKKLPDDCL
jgi:hypothetical protein